MWLVLFLGSLHPHPHSVTPSHSTRLHIALPPHPHCLTSHSTRPHPHYLALAPSHGLTPHIVTQTVSHFVDKFSLQFLFFLYYYFLFIMSFWVLYIYIYIYIWFLLIWCFWVDLMFHIGIWLSRWFVGFIPITGSIYLSNLTVGNSLGVFFSLIIIDLCA